MGEYGGSIYEDRKNYSLPNRALIEAETKGWVNENEAALIRNRAFTVVDGENPDKLNSPGFHDALTYRKMLKEIFDHRNELNPGIIASLPTLFLDEVAYWSTVRDYRALSGQEQLPSSTAATIDSVDLIPKRFTFYQGFNTLYTATHELYLAYQWLRI